MAVKEIKNQPSEMFSKLNFTGQENQKSKSKKRSNTKEKRLKDKD